MAGPLTRAWRGLADEALAAKVGAAHGERGQRIVEAAQVAATSPIMVRRAIGVRLALMRIEDRGIMVPALVWSLPVGVAEAVARWAKRDPETAWRHADDYAQDRITFQALVDAERLSRGGEVASRKSRTEPDRPDTWRIGQVTRFAKLEGRRILPPAPDDIPVHGWLHDDAAVPTGVLAIGPHDDAEVYMTKRASYCVVAVGIARLVGRAVMLVPDDLTRLRYAAWLTERSVSPDEVRVVAVAPAGRSLRGKWTPPNGADQS